VAPHALERYGQALAPLGLVAPGIPALPPGDEAERWASAWLAERFAGAAPVALCPGARHFTKRWPEPHWVALAGTLIAAGIPVIAFSLAAEKEALPVLAAALAAAPRTAWVTEPLPRMAALLGRCRSAVTCDSGLMHLAAARGIPVVAMFGSTSPALGFAPAGEGHAVLCRNEPCQPCTIHGRPKCPKGHFHCMTLLAPDTVRAALVGLPRQPL
jgi:ADP-heptose:LPS heptosyltransferase